MAQEHRAGTGAQEVLSEHEDELPCCTGDTVPREGVECPSLEISFLKPNKTQKDRILFRFLWDDPSGSHQGSSSLTLCVILGLRGGGASGQPAAVPGKGGGSGARRRLREGTGAALGIERRLRTLSGGSGKGPAAPGRDRRQLWALSGGSGSPGLRVHGGAAAASAAARAGPAGGGAAGGAALGAAGAARALHPAHAGGAAGGPGGGTLSTDGSPGRVPVPWEPRVGTAG